MLCLAWKRSPCGFVVGAPPVEWAGGRTLAIHDNGANGPTSQVCPEPASSLPKFPYPSCPLFFPDAACCWTPAVMQISYRSTLPMVRSSGDRLDSIDQSSDGGLLSRPVDDGRRLAASLCDRSVEPPFPSIITQDRRRHAPLTKTLFWSAGMRSWLQNRLAESPEAARAHISIIIAAASSSLLASTCKQCPLTHTHTWAD